jgi:hypothetical protein
VPANHRENESFPYQNTGELTQISFSVFVTFPSSYEACIAYRALQSERSFSIGTKEEYKAKKHVAFASPEKVRATGCIHLFRLTHSYLTEQDFVRVQVDLTGLYLMTKIQLWSSVGHSASQRRARDIVFYFWYLVTIAVIGPLLSMSVRTTFQTRRRYAHTAGSLQISAIYNLQEVYFSICASGIFRLLN